MEGRKNTLGAWVWIGGLIGTLCLLVLTASAAPARNDCEADLNVSFENELIALINAQRIRNGLKPLALQSQLMAVARAHSTDMACNGLKSHASSDGASIRDRVTAQGYPFVTVGENIATGCDIPREVITVWMNSPGHRRNVLDSSFTEIGTGYVCHSRGRLHGYWTAVFGRPLVGK